MVSACWVIAKLLGAWVAGARCACSLARRRDRGCKRRGGFAGNRLQGFQTCELACPCPARSWAEADPKCAGGGAPSHGRASARRQDEGCKEPARTWALHGGKRRRAAAGAVGARRGGPVGAAERGGTEHARRPLSLFRGVAGSPRWKGSNETS